MTVTLLASSGVLLSGCVTDGRFATLSNGACGSLPRAEYQIRGADRYSQQWSDKTVEAEVAGCGFVRPKARPIERPKVVKAPDPDKPATFKKRWYDRFMKHKSK